MAEREVNVIGHLLEVEKDASTLVSDAQTESAKRLAAARAQADTECKQQYDQLVGQLEKKYTDRTSAIEHEHSDALAAYKSETEKTVKDTVSFNKLLDSVMFSV